MNLTISHAVVYLVQDTESGKFVGHVRAIKREWAKAPLGEIVYKWSTWGCPSDDLDDAYEAANDPLHVMADGHRLSHEQCLEEIKRSIYQYGRKDFEELIS